MRRTLSHLLVRKPASRVEHLALRELRKRRHFVRVFILLAVRLLLLERQVHHLEEALEVDARRAGREEIGVREGRLLRLERNSLHRRFRVRHLARHEAPPHEVVELELCGVHPVRLRALRRERDVRRTYRLVRALSVRLRLEEVRLVRIERRAVFALDEFFGRSAGLLGDVNGVRSHVRDAPLLVERLRELHRLSGRI